MPETSIRVSRKPSAVRDRLRSYKVELDGAVIGKVRTGRSVDFNVDPGHHRLRIRADWTGSQILSFEIRKGEVVRFQCRPNGHSLGALLARFKSSDRPGDPWVDLREIAGDVAQ